MGRRVFDVNIEGGPVELDEYDIAAEVGPLVGVVKTFTHEVTDGQLDIEFSATVDQPKITGIEVFQVDALEHQQVAEGWNMLALPKATPSMDYQSIFDDVTVDGQPFVYANDQYTQASLLVFGTGFWLFSSDGGFQAYGNESTVTPQLTTSISAGWQLIGGPSCLFPIDQSTGDVGLLQSSAFGYDAATGYVATNQLVPGKGYWINSSGSGTLTMNCNIVTSVASKAAATEEQNFPELIITDATGAARTLLLGGTSADVIDYLLPPPAPSGQIDVRFAHGSRMLGADEGVVQLRGMEAPITVALEGAPSGYFIDLLNGSDWANAGLLADGTSLVLSADQVNFLRIRTGDEAAPDTPVAFALHGVYPNPFTTSGTVVFDAPDAANVSIAVYSMLGQRVASFETSVSAGARQGIEINRADLASGAYVYRITVESAGDVQIETGRFVIAR